MNSVSQSKNPSHSLHELNVVERSIRSRKTSKVLLPLSYRAEQQALWAEGHTEILRSILETASWAPFHKQAHERHITQASPSLVPWRFYVVEPQACTSLLSFLESRSRESADPKWGRAWQSKIKEMLCGCGVLVQATWLADPAEEVEENTSKPAEFNLKNVEHVAAASSAIQSLLIAAESHQWLSYWSSGGILRDAEVFDRLGIGADECLLGSLFLTPVAHPEARIIEGGLRERRGSLDERVSWVR